MSSISPLVDDPDLGPLWHAVHDRLCAGDDPAAIDKVRVPNLSRAGVYALRAQLDNTTRRRRDKTAVPIDGSHGATVPLRELLVILMVPPEQLIPLVERVTGRPVINRAVASRAVAVRREELWSYAGHKLPGLPSLLKRMREAGLRGEEPSVYELIDALATVVSRLPLHRPISLAKLAHDCTGDPHYFDLDTLAGARLVAAVAELTDRPDPIRPDHVRAMLADAGILADRLWSTVLLFNVKTSGDGAIDRRLQHARYPVALTLLDLTVTPPTLAPQILTVVENPSVIEEAMGNDCRIPLACTGGQLGAVDHALLQLAADQPGVSLRYAGDIDSSGLQIAHYVAQQYGAQIVAMDAEAIGATSRTPSTPTSGGPYWSKGDDVATVIYQEHDTILRRLGVGRQSE